MKLLKLVAFFFAIICLSCGCSALHKRRLTSPSCGIIQEQAFSDPRKLIEDFVLRDRRGEFLNGSTWLAKAVLCPKKLGTSESISVIESVRVVDLKQGTPESARSQVLYQVVGSLTRIENGWKLEKQVRHTVKQAIEAQRTDFGWRLIAPQYAFVSVITSSGLKGLALPINRLLVGIALTPSRWGEDKLLTAWQVYIDRGTTSTAAQLLHLLKTIPNPSEQLTPSTTEILLIKQRMQKKDPNALHVALALVPLGSPWSRHAQLMSTLVALIKTDPKFFIEAAAIRHKQLSLKTLSQVVLYSETTVSAQETNAELLRRRDALASARVSKSATIMQKELLSILRPKLTSKSSSSAAIKQHKKHASHSSKHR